MATKRELILMRHGKSDWSKPLSDYKRPVKKRGYREAESIGRWLKEQGMVPDRIISSPAVRAKETAQTVASQCGYNAGKITWNDSVYMADVSELLDAIASTPDECTRLLVVGHNPGLEDLVFYLTENIEIPDDGKVMPTATIAVLETEKDWADLEHASCTLSTIIRGRYL